MYIHIDQFIADFAGQEYIWAEAESVPAPSVTHGSFEVLQTEHCAQSHQAVRVVPYFRCHIDTPFTPLGQTPEQPEGGHGSSTDSGGRHQEDRKVQPVERTSKQRGVECQKCV